MKYVLIIFGVVASCLTTGFSVHADIISQWNFNNSTTTPNIGSGSLQLIGGVTVDSFSSETDSTNTSSDPASSNISYATTNYPAQGTGNKTAGIEFDLSTTGYQAISILFDLRSSNTSSKCFRAQYSIDSVNFVDFGTKPFNGKGDKWNDGNLVDLSAIVGVNDNPNFRFRVVSEFEAPNSAYTSAKKPSDGSDGYKTSGKYRFDMVTVSGIAVPEPSSMVLLLSSLTAGLTCIFLHRK